jgi:hypothetical protein
VSAGGDLRVEGWRGVEGAVRVSAGGNLRVEGWRGVEGDVRCDQKLQYQMVVGCKLAL